jgi:broad specificity phosphatase PhoE
MMTDEPRPRDSVPAEVVRLFVFARHAESTANAEHVLSSDPSRPVALTARGRAEASVLGVQLANVHVDLAVATRLLRTQQTIDIALHGRQVPVLIEPDFDELRGGDLDGEPIEAYWSWKNQHSLGDRMPHGESPADALHRYANALRRLLARTETVTLVVIHELGLRYIVTAAAGMSRGPDMTFANAVPFLFHEHAVRHAAASLDAMALSGWLQPGA